MGFWRNIFTTDKAPAMRPRNYAAAKVSRLTNDWTTEISSPSTILRSSLQTLRARSRDLAINNDYARGFLWLVAKHVVGPNGIKLQNKSRFQNGTLDKKANDRIEAAWAEWNETGNCDVTGRLNGVDSDRIFIQSTARDGEVLIRIIEDFDNRQRFALQFIEADHLDESLNMPETRNGNTIRMGIEYDRWMRPVAYHILTKHPGDYYWTYRDRKYERVPADQVLHPFIIERVNQPRGVPWMHSAMTRLNNIGAYEEAEIVAARVGASAMGIWEPDPASDAFSAPGQDATDSDETPIMEMEPGIFVKAPLGYKFNSFDPQHPNSQFSYFMKSTLRGIASGLLVSYNTLASDLEGVNYSSIRAGVLEERDNWRLLQSWMIQNYKAPVFRRWLRWMMLTEQIPFPFQMFDRIHKPKFIARTWAWVDPQKDIEANVTALDNLLTTRTDLAAEQGDDFEEILVRLAEEKRLMEEYGVEPKEKEKEKKAEPAEPEEEDDEDENEPAAARSNGNGSGEED